MSATENIQTQRPGLTHVHGEVTLVPALGKNRGIGKRIVACESLEYGNGAKHVYIGGTQLAPVTIGPGKAEPSWKMSVSKVELHQIIEHLGRGYLQLAFRLNISWRLPGFGVNKDSCVYCMIEDDGIKSKTGDAAMADIAGKCTKVLFNGIDPFDHP